MDKGQANELERLATLRRLEIMDTPPEPEFDELVETAAAICETPISLVTLLDEKRGWFRACYGINLREAPREVTFCEYTIQQTGVLQVENATLDERFRHRLQPVGGMTICFYAGVPIHSSDGRPLGTLCVLDHVARRLKPQQTEALKVLGLKANARLELREQRICLRRALQETELANARLLELATTDELTGLLNRRAFRERLATEFALAYRNGSPLSLIMLDLDNFKQCNDRFGHGAGDQLLVVFAEELKNTVRNTDVIVRHSGEEFAILLPQTLEADSVQLAERILSSVRAIAWPFEPVTASAGCASLTTTMTTGADIVRHADLALYEAKSTGKDCVVGYSSGVRLAHGLPNEMSD